MRARPECHKLADAMRRGRGLFARDGRHAVLAAVALAVTACALLLLGPSGRSPLAAPIRATGGQGHGCDAAERLPARRLRVGLVLGAGVTDPFEAIVYRGLQRAVRELGVEGRALVAGPKENGLASYSYLARQGYDVLIGDTATIDGMADAALRFPRTCFVSIDGTVEELLHRAANVRGTVFRVEQAAYLAGYLAALVEKRRPGRHVVSSVGAGKFPQIDRFIAGFQAGARKADPNVTILNDYANDFAVPAKCRTVALKQIAEGSGVVFQVAGACGLGALQAAKEKHVWGVGVDADESFLGPHVLTSVLKNVDVALVRAVKALQAGTFRTGTNATLSLGAGGVGLGRISPRVPRALVAKLELVRRQLISGQITVPAALG